MVRKKIDNRIRVMIENGIKLGHRTLFVIVGDKARDQVVILHHMLSKADIKARPSVLWCYKKELGFSSNRKKRIKQIHQKIQAGKITVNEDDPFEFFISSTKIRYCYYKETHKILGNTYGMCVLQDFEALTPNLLARTVETVEGGGLVVILLRSMNSLKQLYTMCMDVHQRFRTEAHQDVVCRFNERFLLSLSFCKRCLVVDDRLRILPISSYTLEVTPVEKSRELSENESDLNELKQQLRDTPLVGNLIYCCKTLDQAKAVLKFVETITEKTLRATVSLTASRGRGKSAALGLAVAAAIGFGYSHIFVTSPSPENLNTFFEFVFKGLEALEYKEHVDYDRTQSTNPDFNKATVKVNILRGRLQTIQYIHPTENHHLNEAELLVIDEAAAIPLPLIKAMLGPYLVFISSTINGYEGTGRSLSLKLLQQLKIQTLNPSINKTDKQKANSSVKRTLSEITLEESIRYKPGDHVEAWLTKLLCLNSTSVDALRSDNPPVDSCDLFYINRDTLFSYHRVTEEFLQKIVTLYFASYYKNSPDDLQVMADAPANHLFCLLGPVDPSKKAVPDVLVIIQACLEGEIPESSIHKGLTKEKKIYGDLIPWSIAEDFQEPDFPKLCGLRIVRIATHPDIQGMGYGTRALELLKNYYEFKIPLLKPALDLVQEEMECVDDEQLHLLEETVELRKAIPPLLLKLSERKPEKIDYIGVSYGLTEELLKFWKKSGFVQVHLKPVPHELTGEHSCIMLNVLHTSENECRWLTDFWYQFKNSFFDLYSSYFRTFSLSLTLSILTNESVKLEFRDITKEELECQFLNLTEDVERLKIYIRNDFDCDFIEDLLPTITKVYFTNNMGNLQLSEVQSAILLGIGLKSKSFEDLALELDVSEEQLSKIFKKMVRRVFRYFDEIL